VRRQDVVLFLVLMFLFAAIVGCSEAPNKQEWEWRRLPTLCEQVREYEPNSPVRRHICQGWETTQPKTVSL
jgi:hypothetical protein